MELTRVNAAYVGEMAKYAESRPDIAAPNLAAVRNGKVTTGMLPDEGNLLLGPPLEIRKSGEKRRWIYGNEIVVIFEDGKVSRIIER